MAYTILTLYRGIALAPDVAEELIQNIIDNGIDEHPDQQWKPYVWKNLSNHLVSLLAKQNLSTEGTRPSTEWISTGNGNGHAKEIEGDPCICFADRLGAEYYATKHNMN